MASSNVQHQETPTAASGFEGFVEEPSTSCLKQVLIPAGKPYSHAYLGPLPDPAEYDHVKAVFPSYNTLQSRVFDETPLHLEFLRNPNRAFRSAPKVEQSDYIAWLNKVEGQKGTVWQEQGIFDIIQLSRYGPRYESTMLLAALQFWDVATHSLHLKCGMLSPTLLDVAAITGLKPLGEIFDPKQSTNDYGFSFANATFGAYIADHHNTESTEVSDAEHVAFLTLWLSLFVFCSRSLQVAKLYIPLAVQLHEARPINLAKLILGHLYQSLDNAALELKQNAPTDKLLVSGPMWLLQLWLLATFESRLNFALPKAVRPMLNRRTEGLRLAQFRKQEQDLSSVEMFSMYFDIFHKCTTFTESMAPFVNCTQGPTWFTSEFPSKSPENAAEVNQVWHAYLSPCLLPLRLASCNDKNQFAASKYFPSYYSRQFGLCQLRPAPVSLYQEDYVPTDERAYQRMFKNFHYRNLVFEPIEFQSRFSCTKKFQDWWEEYYTKASKGKTDAEITHIVRSALSSPIAEKNKSPGMAFNRNTFPCFRMKK